MSKHKVKQNFTHKGKSYKPGDDFESDDQHEVHNLAQQGHIEPPQGQQGQGQPGGQQPGQAPGQDPSQKQQDPSKSQGH